MADSGWSNDQLNSLTIPEGSTSGERITINVGNDGAILVYNASGGLIASIAPMGGTAADGSVYQQGLCIFNGSGVLTGVWNPSQFETIDQVSGGSIDIVPQNTTQYSPAMAFSDNSPGTSERAVLYTYEFATNREELIIQGAQATADTESSFVQIGMISGGSVAGAAGGTLNYIENNTFWQCLTWTQLGINAIGTVAAQEPGFTTNPTPEGWHTPTYNAGWAGGPAAGSVQPLRYRLNAVGNVEIVGVFHQTSATPTGISFDLPVGYRPTTSQRFGVTNNVGGAPSANFAAVDTSGNFSVINNPGNGDDVLVNIIYPLS